MTFARNGLRAASVALLLSGCASFDLSHDSNPLAVERSANRCSDWVASVDETIAGAGVADAGAHRVPGFPYLRLDRFTASFAQQALGDDRLFAAWVQSARMLDREGRAIEFRNLPASGLARLGAETPDAAQARTEQCAVALMQSDLAQPGRRRLLAANAHVPDDYVDWNRVVGLYPVVHPFVAAGVERWHEEAVAAFRTNGEHQGPRPDAVRYAPSADQQAPRHEIANLLARAPRDALGRISLSQAELDRLFAAYAPVFEVELGGEFDAIGSLAWGNQPQPLVDRSRPVVYRRLAFTRYAGEILPQLVYTAWFPERPRASAIDILAGKLDGVVFRVTLAGDGSPLVYDSIHPCGCYHMFFPTARVRELPSPKPDDEWAFVPAAAPVPGSGQRVVLHVQSATHYLTGIALASGEAQFRYQFEDDDALRSLPTPGGGRRSIYGADGLVAGSERPERWLFWPMGVPSAGTMRQWGHNATAFLGRRHFDDADLIERRFAPTP